MVGYVDSYSWGVGSGGTMHVHFEQISEVAQEFCRLIETVKEADSEWLDQLSQLLPQLHAAVAKLEEPEEAVHLGEWPDLDARFELYAELHNLIGCRDGYWMEFDVAHDGQSMTGSLADDLTDIYCELKQGLSLWEDEPKRACSGIRNSYTVHWGQHLVDAERHLYELKNRNEI